jgi:hypothetical protein
MYPTCTAGGTEVTLEEAAAESTPNTQNPVEVAALPQGRTHAIPRSSQLVTRVLAGCPDALNGWSDCPVV